MRSPFVSPLLAAVLFTCCASPRLLPIRGERADEQLLFEERVVSSAPRAAGLDWESWQLYQSGRFVYQRAGARSRVLRVSSARLQAARAWLAQHDAELSRAPSGSVAAPLTASAVCQVRASVGLVLAAFGDPRYAACAELKKRVLPEAHAPPSAAAAPPAADMSASRVRHVGAPP